VRALRSIMDVVATCVGCGWRGTVEDCVPDCDDDGSLGCPQCQQIVRTEDDE